MNVKDVMTSGVVSIGADASVEQAAAEMKDHNIGFLPVLSENKVFGVVTDRDIVIRAIAARKNPRATRIREIATTDYIGCRPDAALGDVNQLMAKHKIRRLLIVDAKGQVSGVLSLGDMATRVQGKELAGAVMSDVCSDD